MSLIEEIEAAAQPYTERAAADAALFDTRYPAALLVSSPWWPRIKAALVAAQELDAACSGKEMFLDLIIEAKRIGQAQRKFREAIGE